MTCNHCQQEFDSSKQLVTLILARLPYSEVFQFCSGICHALWMLDEVHDTSSAFRTLDTSWFPIIRQLHNELEKTANFKGE